MQPGRRPASPMTMPPSPSAPALPAATVVVLREGTDGPEVLLLRRREGGSFGGLWVFPGGRVEAVDLPAGDRPAADQPAGHPDESDESAELAAARRAAVREAAEEAGLALREEALEVHSHWVPPEDVPRRYSTWFFVTEVDGRAATVTVDRSEVRDHRWVTPEAGLAERDAGTLPLAPPTWMTLWQLRGFRRGVDVAAAARRRPPARFVTRMQRGDDGSVFLWEGDAAYDDGDLERPGARRRLVAPHTGPWRAEVDLPAVGGGPAWEKG